MHLQRFLAILKEKILISLVGLGSRAWNMMIVTVMSRASALVIVPCFFLQRYCGGFFKDLQEQILSLSSNAKILA